MAGNFDAASVSRFKLSHSDELGKDAHVIHDDKLTENELRYIVSEVTRRIVNNLYKK